MSNTYIDKATGHINVITKEMWDLLPEAAKASKVPHDVHAKVPKIVQSKINQANEQNSNGIQSDNGVNTSLPGGDSEVAAGKKVNPNSVGSGNTKSSSGQSKPKAAGKSKVGAKTARPKGK